MSNTIHNERYWQILQLNIEWLRFSETKATLILTVYGILFTLIYTNSNAVFESVVNSTWVMAMVLIFGAISLTSIILAFLCINPILKNKNPNSIIYFGHISKKFRNQGQYKAFAKSVLDDEEAYSDQITEQIYVISKVAWKKYWMVTWSLRFFVCSIAFLLLILMVYLTTHVS